MLNLHIINRITCVFVMSAWSCASSMYNSTYMCVKIYKQIETLYTLHVCWFVSCKCPCRVCKLATILSWKFCIVSFVPTDDVHFCPMYRAKVARISTQCFATAKIAVADNMYNMRCYTFLQCSTLTNTPISTLAT